MQHFLELFCNTRKIIELNGIYDNDCERNFKEHFRLFYHFSSKQPENNEWNSENSKHNAIKLSHSHLKDYGLNIDAFWLFSFYAYI